MWRDLPGSFLFWRIATGLSPVILGAVRDATGTYTASLFTAAAFMVVSATLFAKLPKFEQ